jgi:hypothetical protein
MAFEFKENVWYLAKARRSFAGMESGQDIYFLPHPGVHGYFTVFDGRNCLRAIQKDRMREYVESIKDDKGFPLKAGEEKIMELHSAYRRMIK